MSGERAILRPSIPVLAWVACSIWAGVIVSESMLWDWHVGGRMSWIGVGSAALVCAATVLLGGRALLLRLMTAAFVCGVLIGGLYWYRLHTAGIDVAGRTTWSVDAVEESQASRFGSTQAAVIVEGPGEGGRVRLLWDAEADPARVGERVAFAGGAKVGNFDEPGRRAWRDGVVASVSVRSVRESHVAGRLSYAIFALRARWRERIAEAGGAGVPLVTGVVLGDQSLMRDTPEEADFRTTGLSHLVAVSGSHLVVVAVGLAAVLTLAGVPVRVNRALVLGLCALYVVGTGAAPSAIRAFLMTAVTTFSLGGGRRSDSTAGLAAAVAASLVWSPAIAFDLGFQLSVCAVAGLVVFGRFAEGWTASALPSRAGALASPLALTLAAQSFTLPITVPVFGMVSVIAPIANLFAGPVVSAILVVGLLGVLAGEVWRPVGSLLLQVASAMGGLTVWLAAKFAAVPGAAVMLGWSARWAGLVCMGAAVGLWVWWPQPRRWVAKVLALALMVVSLMTVVGPRGPSQATVTVLDVGQGDAVLIHRGDSAALVDVGPSESALRAALSRQGVRRLDALFITHPHADHFSAVGGLAGVVAVEQVVATQGSAVASGEVAQAARGLDAEYVEAPAGADFTVGGCTVEVISPTGPVEDASENDSSLVMLLRAGNATMLTTGDAEGDVLDRLVAEGAVGDIDVIKVGHHGSAGAVTPEALAVLRPEVAIISVGARNRFGHPTAEALDVLAAAGVRVYRTDYDGDVSVFFGSEGYRIETGVRGTAGSGCGKLVADPDATENREQERYRSQARLSHLWDRRPALAAGTVASQGDGGRGGGSRLQHGHIRRRGGKRRRRCRGCEHIPLRL